jgi:hypothetical protein
MVFCIFQVGLPPFPLVVILRLHSVWEEPELSLCLQGWKVRVEFTGRKAQVYVWLKISDINRTLESFPGRRACTFG